jgi:hypothetical protein
MDSLLILHIIDQLSNNFSSELKIAGLKKLKTLTVANLAHLDKFVGMDTLLELSVTRGVGLKECDLSNIAKRFKNLQKCEICVFFNDLVRPEEYAQIVQDVFQDSATSVKIVFEYDIWTTYLTKEPFQRCVVKRSDDLDLDSDVLESDD